MNREANDGEVTCPPLLVTAAHRYCLGQATGIVLACVNWCCRNFDRFDRNTQQVMLRDTIEALAKSEAGMDCDARDWRRLIVYAWPKLDSEARAWVRDAVRHLGDVAAREMPQEPT